MLHLCCTCSAWHLWWLWLRCCDCLCPGSVCLCSTHEVLVYYCSHVYHPFVHVRHCVCHLKSPFPGRMAPIMLFYFGVHGPAHILVHSRCWFRDCWLIAFFWGSRSYTPLPSLCLFAHWCWLPSVLHYCSGVPDICFSICGLGLCATHPAKSCRFRIHWFSAIWRKYRLKTQKTQYRAGQAQQTWQNTWQNSRDSMEPISLYQYKTCCR